MVPFAPDVSHKGDRMEIRTFVLGGFEVSAYVVHDGREALLIDAPEGAEAMVAFCEAGGLAPRVLVNTHGLPLTTAYDRLAAEAKRVREVHYQNRVRLQTEQVWPDLFHIFARAGWTITPKLLKENLSSVVMAIALGAAIQYEAEGTALWASPDLWNMGMYPGHSPEALRSALLMALWMPVSSPRRTSLAMIPGGSSLAVLMRMPVAMRWRATLRASMLRVR